MEMRIGAQIGKEPGDRTDAEAIHDEVLITDFLLMVCSVCILLEHNPEMTPSTMV